MAVIIKEKKVFENKEYEVSVYRTKPGKFLTDNEREKADKFDDFLSKKIKSIENELTENKLIDLKGKKGKVLKLWYEVGKRLSFIMDTTLIDPEERVFVFRAIYDHANKINPGPLSKRVLRDPETSHFSYCYQLSNFSWDFVSKAGDWTSWSEFFDRKVTKNDKRIIKWLASKANKDKIGSRQNWLRPLTKEIHGEFIKIDTSFLTEDELYSKLDRIFLDLKKYENE